MISVKTKKKCRKQNPSSQQMKKSLLSPLEINKAAILPLLLLQYFNLKTTEWEISNQEKRIIRVLD